MNVPLFHKEHYTKKESEIAVTHLPQTSTVDIFPAYCQWRTIDADCRLCRSHMGNRFIRLSSYLNMGVAKSGIVRIIMTFFPWLQSPVFMLPNKVNRLSLLFSLLKLQSTRNH